MSIITIAGLMKNNISTLSTRIYLTNEKIPKYSNVKNEDIGNRHRINVRT